VNNHVRAAFSGPDSRQRSHQSCILLEQSPFSDGRRYFQIPKTWEAAANGQGSEVFKPAHGDTMSAVRDYALLAMLLGRGFRRPELVGSLEQAAASKT